MTKELDKCTTCKKPLGLITMFIECQEQCDECAIKYIGESSFLGEEGARNLVKVLREYINKNGSASINGLNKMLTILWQKLKLK